MIKSFWISEYLQKNLADQEAIRKKKEEEERIAALRAEEERKRHEKLNQTISDDQIEKMIDAVRKGNNS